MNSLRVFTWSAFILFAAAGCGSSLDIPSKEESRNTVRLLKPQLHAIDSAMARTISSLPKGFDLISRTRLAAVNKLLDRVAHRSLKDIHINFLSTRPLWREEKSVLGISYANYVDIDSGMLDIDLKKFRFSNFFENTINAEIEIEGTGVISASGKYAGVAATASPRIHFYLNEQIQFIVSTADSDYIRLLPVPKTVHLKTKLTIALLGLHLPYYQEIPIKTTDIVKPILVPSAISSEIVFPIPAARYGTGSFDFVKRKLRFTRAGVRTGDNVLEYHSNIRFEKEY